MVIAVGLGLAGLIALATGCRSTPDQSAHGTIAAAWTITDLDQQPTVCERVGAATVTLQLRNRAGVGAVVSLPCAVTASMADVIAGAYDVTPELRGADGSVLATAPAQLAVTVGAGQRTALSPILFLANTRGVLVLSLATPNVANCRPAFEDGAGITANQLTLEITGDGCEPATFVRRRGTAQLGTYVVSCSRPQLVDCIEQDETLTASVPSGSHHLRAFGNVGFVGCWQADDDIEIQPGRTLVHVATLARRPVVGC